MSTRLRPPPVPATAPPYLAPYVRAAQTHGGGFGSLLWASPQTQDARFDAVTRIAELSGRHVLDVGCGRADLLEYLIARGVRPAGYVGIEAVGSLADEAELKARRCDGAAVVRADFIADPTCLSAGADVVVFSGSVNTVDDAVFYRTLRLAFGAAAEALVFNFLASATLAGRHYLSWRRPADVLAFARTLSPHVRLLSDYLEGDCTAAVSRAGDA